MSRHAIVIKKEEEATLLIDPMRRTILSFLSDKEMTETHLSHALGLSEAAVGHHLRLLEGAGFVKVVRRIPERHGILQKFYRASASSFVIDQRKLPLSVTRYFFPINMERARGILAALTFMSKSPESMTSGMVEELSEYLANQLADIASTYKGGKTRLDREQVILNLYCGALNRILENQDKTAHHLRKMMKKI